MSAYPAPLLRRRARLLAGCALALGLGAQAQAQNAFQADVTGLPLGSVNVSRGLTVDGKLTDVVNVTSKQAVINWSATGNPIADGSVKVLDTNTQLLFTADGNSVGAYTVLNRVLPTAPGTPAIRIDGIVKSQLDFGYGATAPGGSIWFYSPGGIIAGATSQFDVGSLVLSAADIAFDEFGYGGLFGTGVTAQTGTIQFRGSADSRSFVTVESGATLKANDNYLALFAPRVTQAGSVSAAGSIAYVAAEAADITIPVSGGLFDIAISQGSKVDAGGETTLTHSGTTTGPEAGAITDRRIYMVAVPKNDAVTMLVSGSVGYTPASGVELADGQIILAAASSVSSSGDVSGLATGNTIKVTGGAFSSSLKAVANRVTVDTSGSDLTAAGDLELRSNTGTIALTALAGTKIAVAGNTLMRLDDGHDGASISITAATGATVGFANLSLESENLARPLTGVTGGDLSLTAADGFITAADVTLQTRAFGGSGSTAGGAATGGAIALSATGSGRFQANFLSAEASASGGDSGYGIGGSGTGGSIAMLIDGGEVSTAGISFTAFGEGGAGNTGGPGFGGTVTIAAKAGGTFSTGDIDIGADGFGADGSSGGNGKGGTIALSADGAVITASNLDLFASGSGGDAFGNGNGGFATGGTITIFAANAGQITGGGTIQASGFGGYGSLSGVAGDATGGTVDIQLTNGKIDMSGRFTRILADGSGGDNFYGNAPALGRGGRVTIGVSGDTSQLTFGVLEASADGRFNEFFDGPSPPNHGGTGVGGTVEFLQAGGLVQGDTLRLTATGTGVRGINGNAGGSGFGGRAALALSGGALNLFGLSISAEAFGGNGNDQDSGYGITAGAGGTAGVGPSPYAGSAGAIVTASGGSLTAFTVTLSGDSSGGVGGAGEEFTDAPLAGAGGAATGGVASFLSSGAASLNISTLRVHANANPSPSNPEADRGGTGGSVRLFDSSSSDGIAGAGGASIGGAATIALGGSGSLRVSQIFAEATGFGGAAGETIDFYGSSIVGAGRGGDGGSGNGGAASILINGPLSSFATVRATAEGHGADGGRGPNGGDGGFGLGGDAAISLTGATQNFYGLFASADGFGGRGAGGNVGVGGAGGRGEGKNASLTLIAAPVSTQVLNLHANGEGGNGGTGSTDAVGFDGGSGGAGQGGNTTLNLLAGSLTLNGGEGISTAFFAADASGGYGGSGGDGQEGSGGNGGNGGDATGGSVAVLSTNGSVNFLATQMRANVDAGGRGFAGIGAVNGAEGLSGNGAAGTVSIDAQHQGSATASLSFGQARLRAESRVDERIEGRGGHIFINAEGGGSSGAIQFLTLDVNSEGSEVAADTLPAIRLTGAGAVKVSDSVDLFALGDIRSAGVLDVAGSLSVTSRSDIVFGSGGNIGVFGDINLRSGDDIIIGSGSLLRGTNGAPPESGYGGPRFDIQAGGISRVGEQPELEISSLILEGTIDAPSHTLIASADAVVGRTNTQLNAGNLYILLNNIPSGPEAIPLDDLRQLRALRNPPCLQGDVCLGNVGVTGVVEIGNPFFGIPNNLRLNGGIDAERVTLLGRNVQLGQANQANFIKASERLTIESQGSSLFLNGTLALQGGSETTRIASALNINGAKADIVAPGTLSLYATSNVTLGSIDAAAIRTVDFDENILQADGIVVPGAINIGRVATPGNLNLFAGKGVTLGFADLVPGSTLQVITDTGLASLGGGSAGDVQVTGDRVSLSVNAAGAVRANAVNGNATLGTVLAAQIDANASGDLSVASASADGSIILSSGGTTSFGSLSGDALSISGTRLVSGGSASGSSIEIDSDGDIALSGTLDAVTAESGYGLGGTIDIDALGDFDLSSGGKLLADRDISVRAGDDLRIGVLATLLAARTVDAGSAPPRSGPGQLRLEAGAINLDAPQPSDPTNVHAVLIGSGASLTGRTVALTGQAIQAAADSSIAGDNLFVGISAAPALGSAPLDDAGALTPDCVRGNTCLGRVAVTNLLRIGEAGFVGNRLFAAGPIGAADTLIRTNDTLTLSGSLTASALQLESVSGDVVLGTGSTFRATSGPLSIVAGRDLSGAGASVIGSAVGVSVGRDATLGTLQAATLSGTNANGVAPGAMAFANARNLSIANLLEVTAAPIDVRVSGALNLANVAASKVSGTGSSVTLGSNGSLNVGQALATGGALSIAARGGDLTIGTGTGASAALAASGLLKADTMIASNGDLAATAGSGVYVGTLKATGAVTLTTSAGAITVSTDLVSGTPLTVSAPSVNLTAQNGLNINQATATSGDLVLRTVAGDLKTGTSSAAGAISLDSAGGLTFASLNAQQAIGLKAGGAIQGGAAKAATVTATAGNGLSIDTLTTADTATLGAGSGALVIADANASSFVVAGASVSLTALNGLTLTQGRATAGDLLLTSKQGSIDVGQASASAGLKLAAAGSITVTGTATAQAIGFTSKDLSIGANGRLGTTTQTKSISLTSTADRVFLGDAIGNGYRLDAGELTRIVSGGDIEIVSAPQTQIGTSFDLLDPAGTNIVMGSFTFGGSQLGQDGKFTFRTPRAIGVTGNVQFQNFNNAQYVLYDAGTDISLAAETGLVTIKNSTGGLAGTLELKAQQVHAMSTKARSEIAGLQLNDVRQRLGTNDQLENNGGYFQANRIIVNIGRLAFIQNSGGNGTDPALKRGITANELEVRSFGTQPVQLVLNGREGDASGQAFAGAITLPASIDAQSGFNGCVNGVACVPVVAPPPPPVEPEVFSADPVLPSARDQIKSEEEEDEKEEALKAAQTLPDPVIQFVPAPRSRFDPLIDEPVTGAGNEDLWEPTTPAGPTP